MGPTLQANILAVAMGINFNKGIYNSDKEVSAINVHCGEVLSERALASESTEDGLRVAQEEAQESVGMIL